MRKRLGNMNEMIKDQVVSRETKESLHTKMVSSFQAHSIAG
jgi:hypothetical protein